MAVAGTDTIILICNPVLIGSAMVGIVLVANGARRRDSHYFSLGLIFLGAPLAIVLFLLASVVGWHSISGLSGSQQLGRAILSILGGIAAGCAVLGLTGAVSKDFFWNGKGKNLRCPREKF